MKKLTAKKLQKFLTKLEERGCDLSKIEVTYRDRKGDYLNCYDVEEGLYDPVKNFILEEIVIGYPYK